MKNKQETKTFRLPNTSGKPGNAAEQPGLTHHGGSRGGKRSRPPFAGDHFYYPGWDHAGNGQPPERGFSGVRFHSDANSVNRSQLIGARAWAQGKDVYFGKGGFSPSVAAHELVHTVQQGAVSGNVSESMPMGAVQMIPNRRAARRDRRAAEDHPKR